MLLYGLIATIMNGRVPKDAATIENVTFNANQNARDLGVLFNIFGRFADACKELLQYIFVQYLKLLESESYNNWRGRQFSNLLVICRETS